MLTEARIGKLSGKTIRGFACLQRPVRYEDGIDATELVRLPPVSDFISILIRTMIPVPHETPV